MDSAESGEKIGAGSRCARGRTLPPRPRNACGPPRTEVHAVGLSIDAPIVLDTSSGAAQGPDFPRHIFNDGYLEVL
ncbi:hypothetical protein GCM10023317_23550 [Actinopolymorpha pittospori]